MIAIIMSFFKQNSSILPQHRKTRKLWNEIVVNKVLHDGLPKRVNIERWEPKTDKSSKWSFSCSWCQLVCSGPGPGPGYLADRQMSRKENLYWHNQDTQLGAGAIRTVTQRENVPWVIVQHRRQKINFFTVDKIVELNPTLIHIFKLKITDNFKVLTNMKSFQFSNKTPSSSLVGRIIVKLG